jgi:soluble lytic murein transglycosylase-like protein
MMPESRPDAPLQDGESLQLPDLGLQFQILHIPGHTLSHIAFWGHGTVFCGDTLFSAGCGRMFEGTPVQMSGSLQRLSALPPETRVFAGHEYTAANLRFALAADPGNTAAARYRELVDALRAKDTPTLPSTIDLENRVNPFCAATTPAIRAAAVKHAGKPLHDTAGVRGIARLEGWVSRMRRILAGGALALAASRRLRACARRKASAGASRRIARADDTARRRRRSRRLEPSVGSTPSVAMPSEWQHHNGEDYDDLFDRMRAGFVFAEVQEPAIDQQLPGSSTTPIISNAPFQRAQRYLYHIVTEVEARGMPLEFALLPVVESAYEPFAYSRSRAAGLWQFIPGTGVRFGLKQDWWYDGRRDVVESTRAALDYLQALHDQFDGDWLLAIAAYNVGEMTVQREFDHNRALGLPTDFWHLKLPAETRAYVPKLLAMKRLMAEPERYGIDFRADAERAVFRGHRHRLADRLENRREAGGHELRRVAALNPGYNRWATDPDGPHRLLVPIDNADGFEAALKTLAPEDRVRYLAHEVDAPRHAADDRKQYNTSVVISKVNDLKDKR